MAKKIAATLFRTAEIDRALVNGEDRTCMLSFSSEHPVERYFGVEILDHGPDCCDLSRLNSGGALLLNHDPDKQCGVVESAHIENRRGVAKVRFGTSQMANEIFEDVKSGIRRLVSVGYRLNDRKSVEVTEDGGRETYRFKRWQPFEISIVPIPADPTVGVGRSDSESDQTADFELPEMKRNLLLNPEPPAGGGGAAASVAPSPELVIKRERERTAEILKLGAQFRQRVPDAIDMANTAVESGADVAAFQRSLLDKLSSGIIPNGDQPAKRGDGTSTSNSGGTETVQARDLGGLIVSSDAYKSLIRSGARGLKENHFSRSFEIPDVNTRTTFTTSVSGLTKYERPPGVVLVEQQPLRMADLVAPGTTENTTIRYLREVSFTNGATALAEEGAYAEAAFDTEEVDASVTKLGVLGRVTEEIFADSSTLQSFINARLPFMVQAREDIHILNGTGSSNQITGILNVSGIQTEAAGSSSTVADAIHKAITKVRSVGFFEPDNIVVHPNDWQDLRLTKDGQGQYYAGGPFSGPYGNGMYSNVFSLWGLPVVVTTAIAEGTALVGSFRLGAQLFRRQGLTIETTNSDNQDFSYGRIAIRVTERLALATYRPLAFCTVTGIA